VKGPDYTTARDVTCWAHGLMLGLAVGVPVGIVLTWVI
jgi:hypothetical protein